MGREDPTLLKDKHVADWFYEVNKRLFKYRYNPGSNFAEQNNMRWEQMGDLCFYQEKASPYVIQPSSHSLFLNHPLIEIVL
jgi:hypothetical protein